MTTPSPYGPTVRALLRSAVVMLVGTSAWRWGLGVFGAGLWRSLRAA